MKLLNSKPVRLTLLAAIITGISFAFIPKLFNTTSVDGIVNAHISTLRSPIEGIVNMSDISQGMRVSKEQPLGYIDNILIDYSYLMELNTERNFLEQRVSSLKLSNEQLRTMKALLESRITDYSSYRNDDMEQEIKTLNSSIASLQSTLNYETNRLNRIRQLYNSQYGAVSIQDLEEQQSIVQSLRYDIDSVKEQIERIKLNINATNNNVFLGEGNNDLPYSNQRMDEIDLQIIRQEAIISETNERIKQIDQQIHVEAEQKRRQRTFDITSNVNGVVWRLYTGNDSSVAIDAELMKLINCDSLFLDVTVDESAFDDISIDQHVKFRFIDDSTLYHGTVRNIQGVGMIPNDITLAGIIESNGNKRLNRVTVDIDKEQLDDFKSNSNCNVGRRIIVTFPKGDQS